MVGDVGAAYSTPEATNVNPANAVFVDRTQAGGSLEAFQDESFNLRYPGFDAVSQRSTGAGNIIGGTSRPSGVLRPSPKWGMGGYLLPPGLSVDIKKKRIPIVILGTREFIDLNAKGTVSFIGGFSLAYRLSDRLGVGIGGHIQTVNFNADIVRSDGGASLASISGRLSDLSGLFGVRADVIPGRLALGFAATPFNLHEETFDLTSPLLDGLSSEDEDEDESSEGLPTSTSNKETNLLPQVLVGFQLGFKRLRLLGDLRYTRANKSREAFSSVDLKAKRRDLHDTLSPSLGAILNFADSASLLVGYKYEPSPIGPGRRSDGDDAGLGGFGTLDLGQVYVGLQPLTPYWQVAGGLQFGLVPRTAVREGKGKGGKETVRYHAITVGGGVGYREASLGIDEEGEQPGAYRQKKMFIPVSGTVKL